MSQEAREELFQLNKERLEHMAFRAIKKGLSPTDFVAVCIDVDDLSWTEVVDALMPGHNWQEYRDRGEKPVARGTVIAGITEYLSAVVPTIAPALTGHLPTGVVRAIVMGDGGASVYHIEPFPHFQEE